MKKIVGVLILCACLMTACQSGGGTDSSAPSGEASIAPSSSSTDSSSAYQVTNHYGGIYEGSGTLEDFSIADAGSMNLEIGSSSNMKFEITYLDDTFGTFAFYDSTGAKGMSIPFTAEGNKVRVLIDYAEDETTVNKDEINLGFEEQNGVITATGTMEMVQGDEFMKRSLSFTKTDELPDSSSNSGSSGS